jgi:hypothetical protein
VRRARYRGKDQRGAIKGNMTRWIAGVECYLSWGARQAVCDQSAVYPHALSRFIYSRPCKAKARACVRRQYFESLALENAERGIVQGLDPIVREYAPRLKRVPQGSVMTTAIIRRRRGCRSTPWAAYRIAFRLSHGVTPCLTCASVHR